MTFLYNVYMNNHPVTKAHLTGNLPQMIDEITEQLIEKYPSLSPNRAKEIAGAYILQDYNQETETLTDDEWMDLDDLDETPRAAIIDHSGNRGIMYDLDNLEHGRLDYTL